LGKGETDELQLVNIFTMVLFMLCN